MDEDFGELERAASASRLEVKVGASYGSQSMVDPLRTVLVRRPEEAFAHADPKIWGYTGRPDLIAARTEHAALVEMLRSSGAEVWYHEEPQEARADAIFVHDPVLVTDRGAIVLRMGKELRRGEEASIADSLTKQGVPILGTLRSPATAEGGDLLWINHDRLAPNVLAVAPRDCITLEGNPITQRRLEEAGCRVRTYRGNEISRKAEGGATCLTRPVLRARRTRVEA